MERNAQRINGSLEHLHKYSDEELANGIGYAHERAAAAAHDIEALQGELFRRGNPELPLGELATVHYFQTPTVTELPPEPAA